MKIALLGFSGSGKSTLARKLAAHHGAEVLYLDSVHWLPGWREREREEEVEIVTEFLNTHEEWVIDGNYRKICFDRRAMARIVAELHSYLSASTLEGTPLLYASTTAALSSGLSDLRRSGEVCCMMYGISAPSMI